MIAKIMARFPRLLLRIKGGRIGSSSRMGRLRSWSWIGKLTIGDHVHIGPDARLFAMGGITISDGTIAGPRLTIYTSNHNFYDTVTIPYANTTLIKKAVVVGRGCWLGDSVMLLAGTQLGDHCLVGAGAVVRGRFPAGSILMGNPATVVKVLDQDQLAQKQAALDAGQFLITRKDRP